MVGAASSAEQALMQLDYVGVDVVLMDVGLPGMDGVERYLQKVCKQSGGVPSL